MVPPGGIASDRTVDAGSADVVALEANQMLRALEQSDVCEIPVVTALGEPVADAHVGPGVRLSPS